MAARSTSRWRKALIGTAAGLAALILGAVAAWQAGALNGVGLWAASRAIGYDIACAQVSGSLLGRFTCTDLTLADAKGSFLTAKRLSLDWDPWALLHKEAALTRVALTDSVLTRIPESTSASSSSDDFLPGVKISIGTLDTRRFVLAMSQTGEACLNLGGKGTIGPQGFDAVLGFTRCVPDDGQLRFAGRYEKPSGALTLSAQGRDNGALVAALTGIKTAGPTTVALSGSGTLSAFDGKFSIQAQHVAALEASFRARDLTATTFTATFDVAPALLPVWAPRGAGTLSADVTRGPGGAVDVSSADLDWSGVQGALRLTLAADGQMNGAVRLGTVKPFIVSGTTIGALQAEAKIGGSRSAPVLTGAATLSHLVRDGSEIATLQTNFTLAPDGSGVMTANLVGHAQGAALVAPLGGLFGDAFSFRAAAMQPASGATSFDATLAGAAATLSAKASIGDTSGGGHATLTVADLAQAHAGFGGQAAATLDLSRLTWNGDLEGTLQVQGADIAPIGAGVALGKTPSLRAHLRADKGAYAIGDLRLDTAAAAAQGSARLARDGALDATLKTTRGDLAPLSAALGRPLSGAFSLQLTASGTGAAPAVSLSADAPNLTIDNYEVKAFSVTLDARKQVQWGGHLAFRAATPGGAVNVAAQAETRADGWRAQIVKGEMGPARLAGMLAKSGQRYAGAVTLKGELLSPVGFLLGQPMRGTGTVSLSGEGQAVQLSAQLKDVAAGPLKKASVAAEATLAGAGAPVAATLSVKDGANRLAATTTAKLNPMTIALEKLDGEWAGAKFALVRRSVFAMKDGGFSLDRTAIDIAGGTLRVAATGTADRLSASVQVSDISVAPLATLLQLGRAKGTLNADLTAAIAPERTQAQLHLAAKGLEFGRAGRKAQPADIGFDAQWDGTLVTAEGRISGLDEKPATLNARIPVVRAAGSYMPTLAASGPVSAQLRAQLRAERLMALLPLAEETATGMLVASVDVSGDIARPQLSGKIALSQGTYRNYETGTKLEGVNASLDASGGSRAVLDMTATDGNSGTVQAKGEFSLAALEAGGVGHLAGHLDVTLNAAEIVRQDLVDASASGSLAIDLPGDQPPNISGKLRTGTVRVDLGAALPPDIPQIAVTEINGGPSAVLPPPAPSLFSKATLDIAITMPNRVYVTGQGVDSEWNGNLNVAGTLGTPDVSGKLELVRGQAELVGKSFTLEEGRVEPDSSAKGGATVHLVAQNETSDVTVTVTADGAVADPTIAWTSSPSLPKDEILSRLFFGTSTPHLTALQAFQLAQLSGQLGPFGQMGGGGILSFARRFTGLDVLRVEAASGTAASSGMGASIAAGKYVTDQIYVGVKQGTDVSAGTAQVEVKITPHISVDAEAGANSQGSLGASWKWDY